MASEQLERKLAAILVADIVGYSRLAGADEDRILARLRTLRSDLIDPTISVHRGRVVKRTGDGAVVEFRSVVDAVRCAIEIQNGMAERNAGLPPERRIEFRVGIHLGDVVQESDGDLMGDGVNIAARLEGIAKPGTIYLSEDAYRQVKTRLDLAVSDLGEAQLKNISEPVRVYSVEVGKPATTQPVKPAPVKPVGAAKRNLLVRAIAVFIALIAAVGAAAWFFADGRRSIATSPQPTAAATPAVLAKATAEPSKSDPERLSLVVLPFINLSGDPTQDYIADAITEELTTTLSRIPSTLVISRSTAFTYKGKAVDAKQIGKDLGVRYVLEGSAQPAGNRVRTNAQLISAETGAHLWADQLDADRADLLQAQDEIVTRLARILELQLWKVDAARLARTRPANASAEELALQCLSFNYGNDFNRDYSLCDRALQLDPHNALALATVAHRFIRPVQEERSTDPAGDLRRADELVEQAISADPNLYFAHHTKAWILAWQGRPEEAMIEAERSLTLNPNFVDTFQILGLANNLLGRPEKALEFVDRAIRLSPRDPYLLAFYWQKGLAYALMKKDDQAVEWMRKATTGFPDGAMEKAVFAGMLEINGNEAQAREIVQRYLASEYAKTKTVAAGVATGEALSKHPLWSAMIKRVGEGLRRAGMPEK
jgi:class 3 adenylate cyclase/TolB-like protein